MRVRHRGGQLMKIKESPSIILAFHGMLGRKKQTSLLLLLLTLVFSFLTAAVIYSVSSAQVLQDTRCELYGAWQYLRLSDTAADAAQAQNTLPASAQVSTVIQRGMRVMPTRATPPPAMSCFIP